MTNLFELNELQKTLSELLGNAEELDDETIELLNSTLKQAQEDMKNKLDNYVFIITELNNKVELCENYIKNFQNKKKILENNVKRLKETLMNIASQNKGKLEGQIHKAKIVALDVVTIDDMVSIPEGYIRIKVQRDPDKAGIKSALKKGQEIPGCRLTKSEYLRIS